MNKYWEKRFDEFYSANFIDTDLRVGSRKQEREKIKTYISKHISRAVAKERTLLLKEVREKVIGRNKNMYKGESDWRREREVGNNELKIIQRKKLEELK